MMLVVEDTPVGKANSDDSDLDKPDADSDSEDNDLDHPTPAVIHIASQAAVLMIDKYLDLLWECDIYVISIGV